MSGSVADLGAWPVTVLQPGFVVHEVGGMPVLAPALERRVAAIWTEACAQRRHLFNGTVFTADRFTPARIDGHWTEYRRALAQMREPGLAAELRITPLAVTGLLACAEGVVIGRREPNSIYQPGLWQTPPAGSVERRGSTGDHATELDLATQILSECDEELGLPPDAVTVLGPVLAVQHPSSRILDIGLLLRTGLDFAAVRSAWQARANGEYDRLALLGRDHSGSLDAADLVLTPTARALVERWRSMASADIAGPA